MQNHVPPQTAALIRVGRELLRIFCIEKTGTALRLLLLRLRLLRLRSAQAAQAGTTLRSSCGGQALLRDRPVGEPVEPSTSPGW